MKYAPYLYVLLTLLGYVLAVMLFGFTEIFALGIHFFRIAIIMAVLVMLAPIAGNLFLGVPYKSRDFLLAGIILAMLSNEAFSIWNEMHRIFGVDNDVFTSPVSGFFSLLVALSGVMFLRATGVVENKRWIAALVVSIVFSTLLVFIAPMFR